jgi:L-lactate utilization protein LutC
MEFDMRMSPTDIGDRCGISGQDQAAFNAISAYDAAAGAKSAPDASSAQVDKLRQSESDVMDKVSQSLLAYYQRDTQNSKATLSQMEADASGFAKAKQELSELAPENARHTIDAVSWTLGADHNVAMAEESADLGHAGTAAENLAGIVQLSSDFKGAGTNALPADIAAFASQSPVVQRLLEAARTTIGDAPSMKQSFEPALSSLDSSLSAIECNADLPQATAHGVSHTLTDIHQTLGTMSARDMDNVMQDMEEQQRKLEELGRELGAQPQGGLPNLTSEQQRMEALEKQLSNAGRVS